MTATKIKLEPCPCGGEVLMEPTEDDRWIVGCCGDCMMDSPIMPTEAAAARAWNHMALAGEMERMLRSARKEIISQGETAHRIDALLAKLGPAEEVER